MYEIEDIPTKRIYSDKEIGTGAFLGGPLAGGYLIASNFKAFDEKNKAIYTWIVAIITTILVFSILFIIPDNIDIPNVLFPVIYTAIACFFVWRFQANNINKHISRGGKVFSWFRVLGLSVLFLLITLILMVGVYFYIQSQETTKEYGIAKHEITYNNKNVTEKEVDEIADVFFVTDFFDAEVTKYVYVDKVDDNYEISFSILDKFRSDNKVFEQYAQLRESLQSVFPNDRIIINLVVDDLDNVVKRIE